MDTGSLNFKLEFFQLNMEMLEPSIDWFYHQSKIPNQWVEHSSHYWDDSSGTLKTTARES